MYIYGVMCYMKVHMWPHIHVLINLYRYVYMYYEGMYVLS